MWVQNDKDEVNIQELKQLQLGNSEGDVPIEQIIR